MSETEVREVGPVAYGYWSERMGWYGCSLQPGGSYTEPDRRPLYDQAALDAVKATCLAELDRLRAENEALRAQRDQWARRHDDVLKILTGIHSLLFPPHVDLGDGRVMAFRPKSLDPLEAMQALSDRIRSIPDEIAARSTPAPHSK